MTRPLANARMYAVTPEAEAAWKSLVEHVTESAGVAFDYFPYPAPQPLEDLWARPDLGCVFMCGYPIALGLGDVVPLASPIPTAAWAEGRPVYRSDLIVRADSRFERLEDTFGGRLGWTVTHSHSGFNALRHHLLAFRPPDGAALFGASLGPLVTARAILDEVVSGRIDIGPLDAYWHLLLRLHRPELLAEVRVIGATALSPMPAFVTSRATPAATVDRLRAAFVAAAAAPWFAPLAEPLCLKGFAAVDRADFAPTLAFAQAAERAGYPIPA